MKKAVQEFIKAQSNVISYFNAKYSGEFFIKPMLNYNWCIKKNEGFYIVSYWNDINLGVTDAIVIKKNNEPLIYKTRDYTLVIAIECVKIGFVFKNIGEMSCE